MPLALRLNLLLVALAGRLVPSVERSEWVREWEAEICHRWWSWADWKKLTWRNQMRLLKRSLGAFADAFWLHQQATADFDFLIDVRYGLRFLGKNLGFTVVAALILALGIGANTAIFSVVNSVLLKPLPFREPDRLVMVWEHNYKRDRKRNVVGPANFVRWQERNRSFEEMAGFIVFPINIAGEGEPDRVPAGIVTANVFQALGVSAAVGRTLLAEDGREGFDRVVLLGDALWQSRFGGSRDALGKQMRVNGEPRTIVGVMPPGFEVPPGAKLWIPIVLREEHWSARGRSMSVVARLKPGVTSDQAQAEMSAIAGDLEKELPDFNTGWGANVFPLQEDLVGDVRLLLWVLLGAVGAVLLIACANVANLLLARAAAREKELAIRAALGAERARLVRQLLTESLLLGFLGGALGLAVAQMALTGLLAIVPTEVPSFIQIGVDFRVLGYTLALSLLTGVVFGVVPALAASRPDLNQPLKEGGRTSGGGEGRRLVRHVLVASEIALALVLAIGAGLLTRSFARLRQVDAGFSPENVLTLQVSLPYAEAPKQTRFFQDAARRFASVPGVLSAGAISWLPLGGPGSATSFKVKDRPDPPPGEAPVAEVRIVEGDLFRAMGIRLLRGRTFELRDADDAKDVVVVNETLARTFWPNENPLGKRITMEWGATHVAEVIGVVGDVRLTSLETAPRSTLYWTQAQLPNSFMTFMVRTNGRLTNLVPRLRTEIAAIDPEQPVASIQTMEEVLAHSLKRPRFTMLLMGIFAALALTLAAVGVYGVMSYSVSQRTHEIGLRMALGARAADILRMVLRQALPVVLIGIGFGLLLAFAASRLIENLLFNLEASDPVTFGGIALLLVAVALLSCYVPARRATRVDPMVALHYQ